MSLGVVAITVSSEGVWTASAAHLAFAEVSKGSLDEFFAVAERIEAAAAGTLAAAASEEKRHEHK